MDSVESSSWMASTYATIPVISVVTDDVPGSMGSDSGTYTLTDLSSSQPCVEEHPVSNGLLYEHGLFAELDLEAPCTSGNNAEIGVQSDKDEKTETQQAIGQEDDDSIFKFYYMIEDSHEDALKKLENELMQEECEEHVKAEAVETRLKVLEKGAKDWKYIDELQKKKALHKKQCKENRAEKERVIQLRKELAMANRERHIFCCFVCSRAFTEEEAMREHITEKHLAFKKGYDFKCSKCYRRFDKNQKLARHLQTHTTVDIRCNICYREFREEISLKIHMSKAHSMSLQGSIISKEHECKCGKKFGIMEELNRHRYYCDFRENIAEKRRQARQELDAMSSISSPSHSIISSCSESTSTVSLGSVSGKPVKDKSCPFCFLVCASMQSRRRHIERIHPERLTEVEVDQHSYVKVQSPSLPYACDLCSKTFASHASLTTHKRRIHENKKDHECGICGKRYPLPSELRKHIKRVHGKNQESF